jgi:DNA-binding XRE family transcriptional regulator
LTGGVDNFFDDEISERDRAVCQAREKGETLATIAKGYAITRERVRQICKRWGANPPPRPPRIETTRCATQRFDKLNDDERALLRHLLGRYVDNAPESDRNRTLAQALWAEVPFPSKGATRTFGIQLKKARVRAGYKSAERFAKKIGMHPARYRHWERGRSQPSLAVLARICEELHCTPNDLLLEEKM